MEASDDDLIQNTLRGDESAFATLMGRYLTPVYSFIRTLTGNTEDAEDIAQESLFKAWKNLKRFKTGASFKTWLFSIARNTAIDYARKKKPLLFTELTRPLADEDFEHHLPSMDESIEKSIDRSIEIENLNTYLEGLSTEHREVLTLHYREELTLQEISQVLKLPLNTVKSRDRRALKALEKALAPKSALLP
ncbi:MAG: RNA polymerase sigma factor [Patescibacteria group bacterium]